MFGLGNEKRVEISGGGRVFEGGSVRLLTVTVPCSWGCFSSLYLSRLADNVLVEQSTVSRSDTSEPTS